MKVTPPGTKDCNELGLYDMTSNNYEWVNDYWGDYTEDAKTDPTGPAGPGEKQGGGVSLGANVVVSSRVEVGEKGTDLPDRVIRGSGNFSDCRIATRNEKRENRKEGNLGFRLVLSAEEK